MGRDGGGEGGGREGRREGGRAHPMHAKAVSVGILPVAVGGESTGIGTSAVVGVPAEDERRGNTVCFTLHTLTYRLTVRPHWEVAMYI